jgi:hypothetical protein
MVSSNCNSPRVSIKFNFGKILELSRELSHCSQDGSQQCNHDLLCIYYHLASFEAQRKQGLIGAVTVKVGCIPI